MNHASPSVSLTDESGFCGCQENFICPMHNANYIVWWRRNNGLALFFIVRARPLCFQLCGNSLIQHDNAPVHKAWFVEICVEELDWPAKNFALNPIERLWDELEHRLRARPNQPTSVPGLTNALVAEWKQVPAVMFQHLVESLPRIVVIAA